MTRYESSLAPAYFDDLYRRESDPWNFASSDYERDKYAATLAALPVQRYTAALEIGCSIGVLTQHLARRCDTLLAIDVADAALDQARARCAAETNVQFERLHVPQQWPAGRFDLILLSEVVYYLDRADVARLAAKACAALEPDGHIVLVHWLGETHYPLSGEEAAEIFLGHTRDRLPMRVGRRTEQYRLDVLSA